LAWLYSESVDSASPQSAELNAPAISSGSGEPELSGVVIEEFWRNADFWRDADADSVGLGKNEFARVLLAIGVKYNYGLAPGAMATQAQVVTFWQTLQLRDLALAHACALGRESAWQQFITRFRQPLTQAAIGITGSAALGQELADSLYSEMFGLTERGGERRSPLASYSGRGSLHGFLRAALAQRHVDYHRRTRRESPIPIEDLAAASPDPAPAPTSEMLSRLRECVTATLGSLTPDERFLLSAWFLDRRTLLDISRILRVHEATVSRGIKRLTSRLHKELLKDLQASGMSRAAAEEALGTDPRDLDINLRSLLQASQPTAFLEQAASAHPKKA
jgi:RNA polymerase sigma-70 factor, ECF subfamily